MSEDDDVPVIYRCPVCDYTELRTWPAWCGPHQRQDGDYTPAVLMIRDRLPEPPAMEAP